MGQSKLKLAIREVIKELPEWAKNQQITIIAGMELLASYLPGGEIELKTVRCTFCGQCCMTLRPNSNETPYGVDDEGKCKALYLEGSRWLCGAKFKKPFSCLQDPLKVNVPECSIRYEE